MFFAYAIILIFSVSSGAFAESKRLYRYLDGAGKEMFVKSFSDIPVEFRPSASAVIVHMDEEEKIEKPAKQEQVEKIVKPAPPAEKVEKVEKREEPAPPKENGGDNVRFTSPMKFSKGDNGKTNYSGEIKNYLDSKATDIKITISVEKRSGDAVSPVVVSAGGKDPSGLDAGETAGVSGALDVEYEGVKRFGTNISWQVLTRVPAGANPGYGSPATGK